jgi:hypothetical protein
MASREVRKERSWEWVYRLKGMSVLDDDDDDDDET